MPGSVSGYFSSLPKAIYHFYPHKLLFQRYLIDDITFYQVYDLSYKVASVLVQLIVGLIVQLIVGLMNTLKVETLSCIYRVVSLYIK